MAEAKVKKTTEEKVAKVAKPAVKKAVVKKAAVAAPKAEKTIKKETSVAVVSKAKTKTKATVSLMVDVYGVDGKVDGKIALPEIAFGDKVNKKLLAQAVRVYLANQRQGNASTKTRGEVEGSTRKIYQQKGTGRARHGSIRAPIFVKGGIVFGPKPRDFGLSLPKKMKRKALFSALSAKLRDGEVKIVSGLELMKPKTKEFASAMKNLGIAEKRRKVLVVVAADLESVKRAARNLTGITLTATRRLNAYDVLNTKQLLIMKDSISEMEKHFVEGDNK